MGILDILAGLQALELGLLVWLIGRMKSPTMPIFTTTPPAVDHGVWDVLQDGEKVGSVRADSPAWFQHKSEGRSFRNPQTGEVR
jgi:hypothetical protein